MLGDSVSASLSYSSIDNVFSGVEQVDLTLVSRETLPTSMKEHSLSIHYWTTNSLIRQAALQKDELVDEIVRDLLCCRLDECFMTDGAELVINEASMFTISAQSLIDSL